MIPLFISGLRLPEILFIILIILLLFGGKKIPVHMKGLGQGVKSFKEGMSGISKEATQTPEKAENKTTSSDPAKSSDGE